MLDSTRYSGLIYPLSGVNIGNFPLSVILIFVSGNLGLDVGDGLGPSSD